MLLVVICSIFLHLCSASISPAYLQEVRDRFKPREEIFHSFPPEPSWKSNALFRPVLGTIFTLVVPLFLLGRVCKGLEARSISAPLLVTLASTFSVFFAFFVSWGLPDTVLALLPVLGAGYWSLRDL